VATSYDTAFDDVDFKQCANKVLEFISLTFGGRMSKATNLILKSWEVSVNTTLCKSRLHPEHKYTTMCQTKAVSVFCLLTTKEIYMLKVMKVSYSKAEGIREDN
jgi:hypothetical protein